MALCIPLSALKSFCYTVVELAHNVSNLSFFYEAADPFGL